MANRDYPRRREGSQRDRNQGYGRQAEQFEDSNWRDREDQRHYGQMEDAWDRDEDYGSPYPSGTERPWREGRYDRSQPRSTDYHPERETGYSSGGFGEARYRGSGRRGFASFTGSDQGGRDFSGPDYNYGPGRSPSTPYGAYGAGGYGEGVYGGAGRREYDDSSERGWLERAGDEVASWFGDEDAARRREQDHSGRGPAGYTRSDERICENVCDVLTDDRSVDARGIQVTVQDGDVTLDGTVSDRWQKRRAEAAIEDLSGVHNVQNNLRVQESTAWDRNNSRDLDTTG